MDNGGLEVGFCEKSVFRKGPVSTTCLQAKLFFMGRFIKNDVPCLQNLLMKYPCHGLFSIRL